MTDPPAEHEQEHEQGHEHLVVMGVAGCGKSTVAAELARRLGAVLVEGDDLHPPSNVARMSAGVPLTDAQRLPWLTAVRDRIAAVDAAGGDAVVACSALARAYRDVLRGAPGRVRFVHLTGPAELVAARLAARAGHFMPPALLPSQLAVLEPLGPDEDGVNVEVTGTPAEVAAEALRRLGRTAPASPRGDLR